MQIKGQIVINNWQKVFTVCERSKYTLYDSQFFMKLT